MRLRGIVALAVGVTPVFLMTGCVQGEQFALFDQESSSSDRLPSGLPGYATAGFNTDTVRLAGNDDDVQFFIAQGVDDQICALAFVDASQWVSSCGSAPLNFSTGDLAARVSVDDAETPAGWRAVSENVSVRQ